MPSASTGWRQAPLCVLDFETTGLDPDTDEIIAFGTVPIDGGRVRLRDSRHRLVRPDRMPEQNTIVIHGLRSEELRDAPPLNEALDELIAAITGRTLVAHVASIERAFLARAMPLAGLELRNPMIDTAALATELFARRGRPIEGPIGLTPLADALGLPVHRRHEADGDALTTAQVFLALTTQLDAFGPQTIGSLVDLGRPSGPWRTVRRWLKLG